ncbi:Uncharacterized protein WH47_08544 [Habropoda laboriosa]|uniref:Ubiquitin-like domain-containing protein n=1 Tax=Habropoda laboriosa TaxID=597456 RepID=A0A0L7RH83_9HYME|nr:Uncharacterized protein WH47_08544 [Habropoda laboriosa]
MESVELRSSSEDDDDDVYCNSVAKLKVLKKKQISHCNNEKDEKNKQENKEKLKHRRNQQGSDSDLEIVSVEEKPNSSENDVLIVEKNVEEKAQSSEDENYEINIKVMWRSKDLHRLNMCRNENFRRIFEYFANIEQVSIDEILITKKDKIIKKNDTPVTINLSVIDILEGGIITKDSTMLQKNAGGKDENVCVIKVQTTNKKSLTISVKRDENFQNLLEKCAQELNVEESKIKLYFDGELIVITDTPDSLEIEDEACFDLRLSC